MFITDHAQLKSCLQEQVPCANLLGYYSPEEFKTIVPQCEPYYLHVSCRLGGGAGEDCAGVMNRRSLTTFAVAATCPRRYPGDYSTYQPRDAG